MRILMYVYGNKRKSLVQMNKAFDGVGDGIRTHDLRDHNPTL